MCLHFLQNIRELDRGSETSRFDNIARSASHDPSTIRNAWFVEAGFGSSLPVIWQGYGCCRKRNRKGSRYRDSQEIRIRIIVISNQDHMAILVVRALLVRNLLDEENGS